MASAFARAAWGGTLRFAPHVAAVERSGVLAHQPEAEDERRVEGLLDALHPGPVDADVLAHPRGDERNVLGDDVLQLAEAFFPSCLVVGALLVSDELLGVGVVVAVL